jgi:CDP-2,3-bis-(O-geranylgeranyl)-sn-glycerol synthase
MAGDLFSSFVKRRLNLPPHARATGLDQIPESVFPLLALRTELSLTIPELLVTAGIFFFGEIVLSRWFFQLHLRDRPY